MGQLELRYFIRPLSAAALACCFASSAFAQAVPPEPTTAPPSAAEPVRGPSPDAPSFAPPPPPAAPAAPDPRDRQIPTSSGQTVEPPAPPPPPAPPEPKPDAKPEFKWLTPYGFVEADAIWDSTQSFDDLAGDATIARKGSYVGDHSRFTFGARNSRIGVKLAAPEFASIKASAQIEGDFMGRLAAGTAEGVILASPLVRMRHAFFKAETPVIDILMGQTWQLFGWQSYFDPNTVNIQGLPGQIFSRSLQLRLSKTLKTDPINLEIAIAGVRPVQRDASEPDGQAGLRLLFNKWKGVRTVGGTGTTVDAGGIGVSGLVRRVRLPELSGSPQRATAKVAGAMSVDALLPIVPATAEDRRNGLVLTGSYVLGTGMADLYTGLNGGIGFPSPPNPSMASPAPTYNSTIDAGIVDFDKNGKVRTIGWQSFMVGLQYYTPIDFGHVWLSLNYTQMNSPNAEDFATDATRSRIFDKSHFFDGDVFWDITPQIRFGVAYSYFEQTYVDDVKAHNHRVQFSGWYIF